MAKIITSGNSPGPALQRSTIDNPGKVHGATNGITLSPGAVPVEGMGAILANSAPAAIVPYARLKTGLDLSGAKLLTLLATGIALVSPPALSQGAMGPGAPAAAPQPRVAPTPQAPQAPRTPAFIPASPAVAPMSGAPQAPKSGTNAGGGGKGAEAATYGDFSDGRRAAPGAGAGNVRQAPATAGGGKGAGAAAAYYDSGQLLNRRTQGAPTQEPSKAPLPAGYGYDATGRIVYTGR